MGGPSWQCRCPTECEPSPAAALTVTHGKPGHHLGERIPAVLYEMVLVVMPVECAQSRLFCRSGYLLSECVAKLCGIA